MDTTLLIGVLFALSTIITAVVFFSSVSEGFFHYKSFSKKYNVSEEDKQAIIEKYKEEALN